MVNRRGESRHSCLVLMLQGREYSGPALFCLWCFHLHLCYLSQTPRCHLRSAPPLRSFCLGPALGALCPPHLLCLPVLPSVHSLLLSWSTAVLTQVPVGCLSICLMVVRGLFLKHILLILNPQLKLLEIPSYHQEGVQPP